STVGFFSGTALCRGDCSGVDPSACTNCGNGALDAGEACDGANLGGASCLSVSGGFSGGTLTCTPGCALDTSGCTRPMPWSPTGTYTISPSVSYMCASFFGVSLVDFSFASVGFADDGATLTATGTGLPCAPTGGSPRSSPTRSFDLACTAPGSCAETYRFVGMFTTDHAWTGTFIATYAGSCLDCVMQSRPISGAR
ncbi:MAG: hypothetical protein ACK5U8_06580, partial [Deltaproteobacteria bacterium]